ncbi:MAG: response regulator [Cyanobacteria bacterium P01_F01_bin.143]
MIYKSEIIRLILIEEQKVIREGLKILLESESDIKIVGSFNNNQDALSNVEKLKPNIVLVSIALSAVDGFDVIRTLKQKLNQTKIIVFCNEVNASDFVQYLELGVKGCLLKEVSARKIKEIVRYIDKGYTHIEDNIFKTVLPELSDAISALTIADSQFQNSLNSPESEVLFNEQFPLYSDGNKQNSQFGSIVTQFYIPISDNVSEANTLSLEVSGESTKKSWVKKVIFNLALAGFGLAAISLGISSYRQGTAIVIQDAVVNGEIVSIKSPVEGILQEIIYLEGMNLEANQLFAFIQPVEDSKTTQIINQFEQDILLKQEQINNAGKFLSFLQRQLQAVPKKSEISLNLPQTEEETTISIDNSREIINLEQQIFNQQSTIDFLQKELSNLQQKLNDAQENSLNNQIIPLEAPISGAIYNINYREGDLIPSGQEIVTLIDCQNLWVEAVVEKKVAAKINLQKEVSVQLEDRESLILGKVDLIESLGNSEPKNNPKSLALASNEPINNKVQEAFSRVIINVDFANSGLMLQDFCNVGLTAQISINN